MARSYKAKSVVITGASSGIGRALALRFAGEGADLTLAARSQDALEEVAREAARLGARAVAAPTDVTDPAQVEAMIDRAEREFGAVDVLVNNAGMGTFGRVADTSLEDWNRVIDLNIRGVVHGVHAVLPRMIRRREGQIINIASLAGLVSAPYMVPYATTKFAVVGLTRGLHAEVHSQGIHVMLVNPGPVKTNFMANAEVGDGAKPIEIFGREILLNQSERERFNDLPLGMNPDRLAGQIVDAARKRKAEVNLTIEAKLGARFARFTPRLTRATLAQMGRIGARRERGRAGESEK